MDGLFGVLLLGGAIAWYVKRKKGTVEPNKEIKTNKIKQTSTSKGGKLRGATDADAGERIAALHREATEYKGNDWQRAINCLREADVLTETAGISYPTKHFLRLPLFLQQSGDIDSAMNEFQRIIDDTEGRIARYFSHQNKEVKKNIAHAAYSEIYAAMSTACKREKLMDKADEYKKISLEHKAKHKEGRDW